MEVPETITVSATVKEKAQTTNSDGDPDYKLGLDIPDFKSKYPTVIWVSLEQGDALTVGKTYAFPLRRGSLKDGKSGDAKWHFNWRYDSQAKYADAEPEAATTPTVRVPVEVDPRADPTRVSIERQKALAEAVTFIGGMALYKDGDTPEVVSALAGSVLASANIFYAWLRFEQQGASTEPPAAARGGVKAASSPAAPSKAPANHSKELLEWNAKELNLPVAKLWEVLVGLDKRTRGTSVDLEADKKVLTVYAKQQQERNVAAAEDAEQAPPQERDADELPF
jgi:hypothetical protein